VTLPDRIRPGVPTTALAPTTEGLPVNLLIGLTRARVALLVAGLAWFLGFNPPLAVRIVIGILAVAAIAFDGLVDDQRVRTATVPPQRTSHPV